ncbi:hypothetical protein VIGAN_05232300 [Vigna angularis var. angularis]|uniref:Gnk2-homologous domain-containing protein n=1 Tax=Vigna angularis var. angularis TaxID=157739 RepID=A0A0S3S7G2_PHAAN|nr:hypothetical protein VIGAN_05232300 [Vigna angularis var. angularis]
MPSSFRSSLRSVSTRTATTCRILPQTRIVNCRSLKVILRSLKQTMGDLTLGNDIRGYFCRFGITTTASELTRRCSNTVGAIIWYDICIIRYTKRG